MELKLYSTQNNRYPLQAIHIKGLSINQWLQEIQSMKLKLEDISVYPLPGMKLNSISGCLVVLRKMGSDIDIRGNVWCQKIGNQLYIPHYTDLMPQIFVEEADELFARYPHFMHPELGLIELDEEVVWTDHIVIGTEQVITQINPAATPFIPEEITQFRISVVPQNDIENILEDIEKKADVDKLKDRPLDRIEKIKLSLYKKMLGDSDPSEIDKVEGYKLRVLKYSSLISSVLQGKERQMIDKDWSDSLLEDYHDLTNRNKSQLDKLLELLKNNPEKALDYAIPLDEEGTSRGRNLGELQLSKFANDLSSLSNLLRNNQSSRGSGYYSMEDDGLTMLRQQYRNSANLLISEKKYLQASYIYIKLLKDYYSAATMFENARLYQEAGDIYRKLIQDHLKAGECYEKAKLYDEAIEMYKTKNMYEKIGDLYSLQKNSKEAERFYNKEIDRYIVGSQYVRAAKLSLDKMSNLNYAQSLLLRGWAEFADPYTCLEKYLSNINLIKDREKEIKRIFEEEITPKNREIFLNILQKEFRQTEELREVTKDMAYQIVADILPQNKNAVNELITFNTNDTQLIKDTIRYKQSRRK